MLSISKVKNYIRGSRKLYTKAKARDDKLQVIASWVVQCAVVTEYCAYKAIVERIGELQEEKIYDQAQVLALQRELILKSEIELKAVQTTVDSERKSYASMVSKNCPAEL